MQQHNQNTNMPQPGPNNFFYPPMPMIPNQLNPQQAAQMQQYMPQIPPQQPPDDPELKNIIDKLANFVARNGAEFENVTKLKQKDNPKFKFLFGGEYYHYYVYRVNVERDIMRFQQQSAIPPQFTQPPPPIIDISKPPPIPPQSPAMNQNDPMTQIPVIQAKINTIKDQIVQSEKNLNAQKEVSEIKKRIQVEECLKVKKNEKLNNLIQESGADMNTFDQITNRIVQLCTKEAISSGRTFVIDKYNTDKQVEAICYYLMQRIMNKESSHEARLHIIYFMNDLVHHGNKKGIEIIKRHLERVIIPCFCNAIEKTDDEKRSKMTKLLDLWEKNNYFSKSIIEKLRNPSIGVKFHEESVLEENRKAIDEIENEFNKQLNQLDQQHREFVNHSNSQLTALQTQFNQLVQQQQQQQAKFHPMSLPPPPIHQGNMPQQPNVSVPPPSLMQGVNNSSANGNNNNYNNNGSNNNGYNGNNQNNDDHYNPSNQQSKNQPQPLMSLMSINPFESNHPKPQSNQSNSLASNNQSIYGQPPPNFNQPPPSPQTSSGITSQPPPTHVPLMSIPPPSLIQNIPPPSAPLNPPPNIIIPPPIALVNTQQAPPLMPAANSLDLSKPPPGFGPLPPVVNPNDPNKPMVLPEIEMPYYNLPAGLMVPFIKTEDFNYKPLNTKQIKLPPPQPPTEKLLNAIEEFYAASQNKSIRNNDGWEKNGLYEFFKTKMKYLNQKKIEKQEKLEAKRKQKARKSRKRRSRSRSRSRSRNRSRSRSHDRKRRSRRSYSTSSRSRSRSSSRSRSRSPDRRRSNTSSSARRRSRSRSISPPYSASLTAASTIPPAPTVALDQRLHNSNRGYQLLQKMGWSGSSGLGRQEQGIFNPIEGGEVRDKSEQFRGIGAKSDPFEQFRKNKSQGYIQRLRDRDEQRELARKSTGQGAAKDLDY